MFNLHNSLNKLSGMFEEKSANVELLIMQRLLRLWIRLKREEKKKQLYDIVSLKT